MATGNVCSAGFVCLPGTQFPQQYPCPSGTWSDVVGAQNFSSCWPCPPGLYCNSTGLSQPSGVCDTGMRLDYRNALIYVDITGPVKHVSSGLFLCICWTLGYYCSGGAVSAMPSDGETGDICPVGHYCPMGSSYPVACPDGTYSNTTGS